MNSNKIKLTLYWTIVIGLFATLFTPLIVSGGLFFPFITGKAFFFRVIVEIVAGLWLVLALLDKTYGPKKSWILYAVTFFTGVLLLADIFAVNPYKALWSNYERMEGWVTIAHLFLYFVVLGAVLVKEKIWNIFFQTSIGVSIIIAGWGIIQYLQSICVLPAFNATSHQWLHCEVPHAVRADASLGNPIYLAVYLLIHIFILAFLVFRDEKKAFRLPIHFLYAGIAIFDGVALIFTQTRGTMIGLFAGIMVTALCIAIGERKNKVLQRSALGLIVLVLVLGGSFYGARNTPVVTQSPTLSRFASVFTEIEKIGNTGERKLARYYIWDMAFQGFKEKPLLGWGQEGFNFVFDKYYDPNIYDQEQWFDRTHDVFLDWLVAGGALGLLSYLSLFGALLWYLWRRGKTVFTLTEKAIFTGMLVGYFVHNIFVFDNLASYILFFIMLAYVHHRVTEGDHASVMPYKQLEQDQIFGIVTPIVFVVLVVALYYVNYKPYTASETLVNALQPQYSLTTTGQRANDPMKNLQLYKDALAYHSLGDSEIREYLMQEAVSLRTQGAPENMQNAFLTLAHSELDTQLAIAPTDTRYLIFTGSLLDAFGKYTDATSYLTRALASSPAKQTVAFEVINNMITRGALSDAFALAKKVFESQKDFDTARMAYVATAILTGKADLASSLLKEKYGTDMVYNDQIINAYKKVGAWNKALQILNAHIKSNPTDVQARLNLAVTYAQMGDKATAISLIRTLEKELPEYKDQLERYIQELSK